MKPLQLLAIGLLASLLSACGESPAPEAQQAAAASPVTDSSSEAYSPDSQSEHPKNVYWGDTHLHTSYSFDAGAFGNTLDPNAAYRYARGEELTASMGMKTKLARPLDFLVVADHSDNMGFIPDLYAGEPSLLADPLGKKWYDDLQAGKNHEVAIEAIKTFSQAAMPPALLYDPDSKAYKAAWARTIEAAERFNEPGKFTAFIGYEWTSLIKGNNLQKLCTLNILKTGNCHFDCFRIYACFSRGGKHGLWK